MEGNSNLREKIGNQIKSARKSSGYTLKDLADKCDMPLSTISKIENGKWSVGIDMLEKICNALNVTVNIN